MKLWFWMLRMCLNMHSRFVENHPIRILEDGPLISEGVLPHLVSNGTSPSVAPYSSTASALVPFRASDTTLALHCYRGTMGQSLWKNSSLCCFGSCSFFSRARICCNFLFWVCIKPPRHHLGWWYFGSGLHELASWSLAYGWEDPELLQIWVWAEPFLIIDPLKQSPITTSLLPILITSLATLLCAPPSSGTDYSTFSFPFTELFCNKNSCLTYCKTGLTGSPDWSYWC
jgi:hypothetical protein